MYFSTYGLRKTWIDKCLKSPFSEARAISKMVKRPKHCRKLNGSNISTFIDHVKATEVEKVSLSDMQNFTTVC